MPYTVYANMFQVLPFTGFNMDEILDEAILYWPNLSVTASTAPSASASFTIVTDLPNNGPQTHTFDVGDGFNRIPGYGYMASTSLGEEINFLDLNQYVLDRVTVPSPTLAVGYETTPNLTSGASATVNVTMVPSLPDSGYNVGVALAGSTALLADLAILSATVAGSAQVDVVVQNNGLLALSGATVLVTALHNG